MHASRDLTKDNLKVKMHVVDDLFTGSAFATQVWISASGAKALGKLQKKDRITTQRFLAKIKRYAENGFADHEGPKLPIRDEGNGVFRIANERDSLFRLIGFYENDDRSRFVIIDAFLKRGTKLSSDHKARIKEVGRVKRDNNWRRRR